MKKVKKVKVIVKWPDFAPEVLATACPACGGKGGTPDGWGCCWDGRCLVLCFDPMELTVGPDAREVLRQIELSRKERK